MPAAKSAIQPDCVPTLFKSAKAFGTWMKKNHATSDGLWLKIAKRGANEPSVTYPEAVEIALCWGWIDGQKKGLDDQHFLQRFSHEYRVAPKRVAAETMERLRTHAWPGNVRELQNAIERAFALSLAETLTLDDLPPALSGSGRTEPLPDELPTLEGAERRLVAAALLKSGGNKNEAARLLGIDRQRLYRKIEKYGLG